MRARVRRVAARKLLNISRHSDRKAVAGLARAAIHEWADTVAQAIAAAATDAARNIQGGWSTR